MISLILVASLFVVDLQRPTLTIAQAIVESGANTKAIGKVGEKGSMQVREKYWGKVPKTYKAQLKQGEKILNCTTKEAFGDMRLGLQQYNGSGYRSVLYANSVITKAFELTLLGV